MEINFNVCVILEYFKERKIGSFEGIFKDKIHITHRLVVMDTENDIHENL
jgi:hypothetical protein